MGRRQENFRILWMFFKLGIVITVCLIYHVFMVILFIEGFL